MAIFSAHSGNLRSAMVFSYVIFGEKFMDGWLILGVCAQALFTARFIVQWIASERAGESVVPELFWLISLSGSSLLLLYAIHQKDPVFILGQSAGIFIYLRNIHLILRKKKCK